MLSDKITRIVREEEGSGMGECGGYWVIARAGLQTVQDIHGETGAKEGGTAESLGDVWAKYGAWVDKIESNDYNQVISLWFFFWGV